jgi:hypothetical protein
MDGFWLGANKNEDEAQALGRNSVAFRCFNRHGEASNNCKLLIAQLGDPFLCVNCTGTDLPHHLVGGS